LNHFFTQLRFRAVKAGGIGEHQLGFTLGQHTHDSGASRLRFIGHNGDFFAEQAVQN